jgi:hypothetical protein
MNEAELCARFGKIAASHGFEVHPELSGWDLVLRYAGSEPRFGLVAGSTIGIEAKRSPTVFALYQTMTRSEGVEFRAILTPKPVSEEFFHVAKRLKIKCLDLPNGIETFRPFERWAPTSTIWFPPLIPIDVVAGAPNPKRLTKWRIAALRLCSLIRTRGYVTSHDFKAAKISPVIWVSKDWIKVDGKVRVGKRSVQRLVEGPSGLPDHGWEDTRDRLAELDPT